MDKFLYTPISKIHRLTPNHKLGLEKLNLLTIEDILRYQPSRYIDYKDSQNISNLKEGQLATLYGQISNVKIRKSWTTKVPMTEADFSDGVSNIKLVWFSQPYIGKMYPDSTLVRISGNVQSKNNKLYFANPNIEKINKIPDNTNSLFSVQIDDEINENKNKANLKKLENNDSLIPVYRETKGVSSLFISELIKKIIHLDAFADIEDPLPTHIKTALNLPSLRDAILYTHFPRDQKLTLSARKRFLFEEMFFIQLRIETERAKSKDSVAYRIGQVDMDEFFKLHSFTPTKAQTNALELILKDMQGGRDSFGKNLKINPMQRLLEGDVGSGKTLVAAAASYATILEKRDQKKFGTPLQVAYLAPTEILAMQQFESFIKFLAHTGIEIGYLSGKKAMKFPSKTDPTLPVKVSRPQLLKWIQEGKISMLIGTHAITKKSVEFKDLGLIIIDEQHRFGINSRRELAHKKGDKRPEIPHLLSMTATPIPRTLALAIFGDLDLTVIDELPKGRKPIETKLATSVNREKIYESVRDEISKGQQAYVICTRIEKNEDEKEMGTLTKKTVEEEVEKLAKIFPDFKIAGMHSKILGDKRDEIMDDFKNNKIHILVSTSVVEVGVNVPNATIMIIEDADKFGLSQLHQLRGRIGRGEHPSTCYIFSDSKTDKTLERLKNFANTKSGFELAEIDLRERGPGSLISTSQSGVSDLAMEALKNLKLVETAKNYAREIIQEDISFENFPELKTRLKHLENLHLE